MINKEKETMIPKEWNRGDKVMVYEDPITRQKEEGMATIIGKADHGDQYYKVRFDSEPENTYYRFIIKKEGK